MAEYERIFGSVYYPTLFTPEDEEYSKLRQEIIDAPRLPIISDKLPFEDIDSSDKKIDCASNNPDIRISSERRLTCCYDIVDALQRQAYRIIDALLSATQ